MDCPSLAECPFFNDKMENMPAVAETMKEKYCHNNYDDCARYKVFKKLGKSAVPTNLFPNQIEKANEIIGA